ncbi:hypothetical protein D3C80_820520 [compost metagenome]
MLQGIAQIELNHADITLGVNLSDHQSVTQIGSRNEVSPNTLQNSADPSTGREAVDTITNYCTFDHNGLAIFGAARFDRYLVPVPNTEKAIMGVGQCQVEHPETAIGVALYGDFLQRGGFDAASQCEYIRQRRRISQLVNGGALDQPVDGDLTALGRNKHCISGLQTDVLAGITPDKHLVEIHIDDFLPCAFHLDFSQGTDSVYATCGLQYLSHGRHATDIVSTWAVGVSHDKHLHGTH